MLNSLLVLFMNKFCLQKLKSDQSYCLRGRQYSRILNQNENEKVNPKSHRIVKGIKGKCSVFGRNKSQVFTK